MPEYIYSKADLQSLENYFFNSSTLDDCLNFDAVEDIWSSLKLTYDQGCELFVPKIFFKRQQYPPWFGPQIKHLTKCTRTQKRLAKFKPSTFRLLKTKSLESELQTLIEISLAYENDLITTHYSNPKKLFWQA